MANTQMPTSAANAVKVWEMKTWLQATRRSVFGNMLNRGVIYVPPELNGNKGIRKGDKTTFDFVGKLTNVPKGEGETLLGNEEAMDIQSHSMIMNMSRIGVAFPNTDTIEQQRTNIAFDKTSQTQAASRVVELIDASVFNQLAGANPTSVTIDGTTFASTADKNHIQGHNTIVAPTTNRIIRAGAQANDESLSSSHKMSLKYIDYLIELADLSLQPVERLDADTFDLYVSPEQLTDLQHDTSSPVQWYNIELAKLQAARKDNTIEHAFDNDMVCAGMYRNVRIFSSPRVAYGVNSSTSAVITTVRRAVMVGRNALSFASPFGSLKKDNGVPVKYFEELYDFGAKKATEARLMYGLKKMSPSSKEDIGVLVLSTYAAAHT